MAKNETIELRTDKLPLGETPPDVEQSSFEKLKAGVQEVLSDFEGSMRDAAAYFSGRSTESTMEVTGNLGERIKEVRVLSGRAKRTLQRLLSIYAVVGMGALGHAASDKPEEFEKVQDQITQGVDMVVDNVEEWAHDLEQRIHQYGHEATDEARQQTVELLSEGIKIVREADKLSQPQEQSPDRQAK